MMPVFRPHSSANVERMEFAKKLVNLMRDRNLNQADLARRAGLTRDAVSTYVRARSMPEPINMAKLAKALGVEPSYFQLDYYRVAERMASPEPFDPALSNATTATPPVAPPVAVAPTEDQINIGLRGDGKVVVSITLITDMDTAVDLASYVKGLKRNG